MVIARSFPLVTLLLVTIVTSWKRRVSVGDERTMDRTKPINNCQSKKKKENDANCAFCMHRPTIEVIVWKPISGGII